MSYEKNYEIKEPKENLHWISYNTKKQADLLKEIKELLVKVLDKLGKPSGLASKDEDLPF